MGEYKCQVNLESPEESYLLKATATNSEGEVTSQILLEWGCEEEVEEYAETEEELIVEQEEIIEEESYFDTLKERIFFEGDSENNRVFPDTLYIEGIDPKAESLNTEQIENSKKIIIRALRKYPEEVLIDNLEKIYVLGYLELSGIPHGGANYPEGGIVYIKGGYVTDYRLEQLFHTEFSSVLLFSDVENFTEFTKEFIKFNPDNFEYSDTIIQGIKEGKVSKNFDPKLHEIGFLNEYAQTGVINDFNSFAENLFLNNKTFREIYNDKTFWEIYDKYPLIKAKTDLVIEFYNSLDSTFTKEYFLKLSEGYVPNSFFDSLDYIVRFEVDDFFNEKFDNSRGGEKLEIKIIENQDEIDRSKKVVYSSLEKYFEETLIDINLRGIYVFKSIYAGAPIGVFNVGDLIMITNYNYTDLYIEELLHSEISNPIWLIYSFNEEGFRKLNSPDFEYYYDQGKTNAELLNRGEISTVFDSSLFEVGFLDSYSMTHPINDYNAHTKNLFKDSGIYWEITDSGDYPILTAKRDYIIDFFENSVHPGYTEEYFREVSQQ